MLSVAYSEDFVDIFEEYFASDYNNLQVTNVVSDSASSASADSFDYSIEFDDAGLPIERKQTKVPRMLKRDIRRSYANMFINVINSCNTPLLVQFFKSFFHKEFVTAQHLKVPIPACNKFPAYFEIRGAESAAEFWYSHSRILPDSAMHLTDTKIIRSKETKGAKIVSELKILATKCFDVQLDQMLTLIPGYAQNKLLQLGKRKLEEFENRGKEGGEKQSVLYTGTDIVAKMASSADKFINKSLSTMLDMAPALMKPVSISMAGTLTMYVDSNMSIERVEFDALKELPLAAVMPY